MSENNNNTMSSMLDSLEILAESPDDGKIVLAFGDLPQQLDTWLDDAESTLSEVDTTLGDLTELREDMARAVEAAGDAKDDAETQAANAEAWAVGTRGGTDVSTEDETYHNNSKYYAEQTSTGVAAAAASASAAATSAGAAAGSASDAASSANESAVSAAAASASATAASSSQTSAASSATAAAASQTAAAASETSASNSAASASSSATSASGSATAAAASASAAAQSAQDAEDVLDSIPPDYTTTVQEVSALKSALVNSSAELANKTDYDISLLATVTIGANILDLSAKVPGLLNADGAPDTSGLGANYSTSAFMPVSPSTTYYVDAFAGTTHNSTPTRVALYNAAFELISVEGVTYTARSFSTTADTKYARISGYTDRMTGNIGSFNLMVVSGSAPTSYVPFSRDVQLKALTDEFGTSTQKTLSQKKETELFNALINLFGASIAETVPITEAGNGFVVNTGGENTTSTGYRRSTQTSFKAGDVIEVTCAGRSDGDLSIINIPRADSACPYFAEVIPASSSVQTHYYQVKSDCKIVFSWVYSSGITVKKISADFVGQILKGTVYNNSNPLGKMDYAPTMISCFKNITCIGDSLTQGIFNTTTGEQQVALPEYSYPAFMKKHTGVDTINLGIGSMCASSQQDNDSWFYRAGRDPYNYIVQSNVGDAVIVALGTNDITLYGGFFGDVDTDINLSDRTQNARNSVGGYANIIQWCREMNPKCVVFCVTISNVRNEIPASENEKRLVANEKIRAIANKLGCFVIDLAEYAETTENERTIWRTTYRNSSHNNALGYERRARQYATYIDWIIENNPTAFQNIQFIGTNYDYVD